MILLVSLIVLLREFLATMFLMVHPYIAIHSYYTCFTHFGLQVENAVTLMRTVVPRLT